MYDMCAHAHTRRSLETDSVSTPSFTVFYQNVYTKIYIDSQPICRLASAVTEGHRQYMGSETGAAACDSVPAYEDTGLQNSVRLEDLREKAG
jgi:hypothetical protein